MGKQYKVGGSPKQWSETAQSITFIVTEDCNLRCKYCYITHKSSNKRMSFETAKRFIDYILTADINTSDDVIIDFFGGEPMIEMQLVDQISDYFKLRSYQLGHKWSWNYRFNFATNGVNYLSPEVQNYISKNWGKVSIGISIDGNKIKHDLNRVFPDGSGSYDQVEKSIPLWIKQFPPGTKTTFASADLKYLKDSILDLWKHGVTDVSANVVFEDVWEEDDDQIFESQLCELADYILDNHLFDKYYCTLFSDSIGGYIAQEQLDTAFCGAGKMIAVGPDGKLFPCVRYKDYSLNNHDERSVGTVDSGINMDLVRPFIVGSERYQSDEECLLCPISSGCPQCQGYSYDVAETPTNFQRAKHICKMQKARVRANNYYFSKLANRYGIKREKMSNCAKMYFLLSNNFVTYCCYDNSNNFSSSLIMSLDTIKDGLAFCHENFFDPVFVHADDHYLEYDFSKDLEQYFIHHIVPVEYWQKCTKLRSVLFVYSHKTIDKGPDYLGNCIYNIDQKEIMFLADDVIQILKNCSRVNVNIQNLNSDFDEDLYKQQLSKIKDYIIHLYTNSGTVKEVNILTDLLFSKEESNCSAGDRSFVYAPNGKFYICPGFYVDMPENSIGDPESGFSNMKNRHLYRKEYHPICQVCDAKHCRNCVYLNFSGTREVNVSPSFQCRKSHIERKISVEMQEYMTPLVKNNLQDVNYMDPISLIPIMKKENRGYYVWEK